MTFEDFEKYIENIANEIPKIVEGMQVVCAQNSQASHKKRFDRGEPKKNYKSKSYKKIRESKGRQTGYIDMQMSGTLYNNMITGKSGEDVLYGVRDVPNGKETTGEIYKKQAKMHPELIKVNSNDAKKGIDAANRFWNDKLKELFN